MKSYLACVAALSLLSACADPLAGVGKLSDVDLAPAAPQPEALIADSTDVAPSVLEALKKSAPAEPVVAQAVEPSPGLFARLRQAAEARAATQDSDATALTPSYTELAAPTEAPEAETPTLAAQAVAAPEADLVEPTKRRGLFGPRTDKSPVVLASLDKTELETPQPEIDLAEPEKRKSIFGNLGAPRVRTGPDARDVPVGTTLAFGEVARVCDAKMGGLAKRIEKVGRGKGFALYDSKPGSSTQRTFYVTGFSDGCARQFTAALALFGKPSMHEQLRYGRPAKNHPYSATDQAYEKVKSKVCKVSKRKPCGDRLARLENNTIFISTYERFTNNGRWADMLLHDGEVQATALKQ